MPISEQEREDAEAMGALKEQNRQHSVNITTLFSKFDSLNLKMGEMALEMTKISTKVGTMIAIAVIAAPLFFKFLDKMIP